MSSKTNYYPKSLQTVFNKILDMDRWNSETKKAIKDKNYSLNRWAKQGVLLLNTCFTVENKPKSHSSIPVIKKGWGIVLQSILHELKKKENMVWFLMGNDARSLKSYIEGDLYSRKIHYIYECAHPAARNGQFDTCNGFYECNRYLNVSGLKAIEW